MLALAAAAKEFADVTFLSKPLRNQITSAPSRICWI